MAEILKGLKKREAYFEPDYLFSLFIGKGGKFERLKEKKEEQTLSQTFCYLFLLVQGEKMFFLPISMVTVLNE